jgi:hypothetical protein
LDDTLPGLGKNFLRGKGRAKALAAYEDYLAFFLMRAYADRPGEAWSMDLSNLVAVLRKELAHGLPAVPDARTWAAEQRSRLPAFKAGMVASLGRDDKRGGQVFDDYSDFHPATGEDAAVVRLAGDLEELERRLEAFLKG